MKLFGLFLLVGPAVLFKYVFMVQLGLTYWLVATHMFVLNRYVVLFKNESNNNNNYQLKFEMW